MLRETGWPTVDVIFRFCVAGSPFKPQEWAGHAMPGRDMLIGFYWAFDSDSDIMCFYESWVLINMQTMKGREFESRNSFCVFEVCV